MKRKRKVGLIIGIVLLIIIPGMGGYVMWKITPYHWSNERVQICFPISEIICIQNIQGYGETYCNDFHNGIDLGTNQSVELIAWCDMRITYLKTWYNEKGGHWQTNILGKYNWKYTFDVAVESWALNETYAYIQRNALDLKVGQIIKQGESIGMLLYHGEGTHIHFGMKESGKNVCPYLFMTPFAQSVVDQLWFLYGESGEDICDQ
ncbi:MAG: peptidoglycan DD-metalloendopeptidase family protein [Candidatus Lokiarchaeota archaeon]|nr:peptidoglycan DD-metalloendopeptidase family protein [Candidatus Lokiarchaeota archaeon]